MLEAKSEGKEKELERRKRKKTVVTETEWPRRVQEALRDPNNVRMTPGKTSVSVAWKTRMPLILLTKTKREILDEVVMRYREEVGELGEVEDKIPSISTLLRLIPKNYRQPKESDRLNNVCVKHSNMSYLVQKVRAVVPTLPLSSRELAGLSMCPPTTARPYTLLDPLTWPEECSLRCRNTQILPYKYLGLKYPLPVPPKSEK